MTVASSNPLISAHKAESSALQVHLHPLVLLTISDYITRHTLRGLKTAIAGAILGQQNGREVSLEHAFECKIQTQGDVVRFDTEWFENRIQQYKQVHKAPVLEIVGWYTITPSNGPQEKHLPVHRQLLKFYNESAILLAFHPSKIPSASSEGGKLPLTIYESVAEGPDGQMDVDGENSQDRIRFRELNYSIETGEAEMISVDFVARGGGNATAIEDSLAKTSTEMDVDTKDSSASKGKSQDIASDEKKSMNVLSSEDEELIASLTAKINAVKMLQSRIQLLSTYLDGLPSNLLDASSSADSKHANPSGTVAGVNHSILRSIQALVNRLPLIEPSDREAYQQEKLSEKKDVSTIALLGSLNRSIKDIREVGIKHSITEGQKSQTKKGQHSIDDATISKLGLLGSGRYDEDTPPGLRRGQSSRTFD